MTLFDDKIRNRLEFSRHLENTYDYYNSSSHDDINKMRDQLDKWFSRYPISEQHELKKRFKSDFSSAFFELFIHEMFLNLGFEITVHPEIQNTNKRPDFLIKNKHLEFYLEAKEARDQTKAEISKINRENQFYDYLNEIHTPNFFLRINTLEIKTHQQPQFSKIKEILEKSLTSLDPDEIGLIIKNGGLESSPIIRVDNEKIFLEISPIPKSKKIRGKEGIRPIGV